MGHVQPLGPLDHIRRHQSAYERRLQSIDAGIDRTWARVKAGHSMEQDLVPLLMLRFAVRSAATDLADLAVASRETP